MNFKNKYKFSSTKIPHISIFTLFFIVMGCIFSKFIINHNPIYMDVYNINVPPNEVFWFGTDSMGRDIYSMIWYGGRISLFIGIFSTLISTFIGIVYGSVSATAPKKIDNIMMRFTEIILSIPSILLIVFIESIFKSSNPITISIVIGITSWTTIAKVIRAEVRQIRNSDYILYAKISGGSFFYILNKHLLPNFIASIMFIVVNNIGHAILLESTLSFLGVGLPIEIISWGSMLTLAQEALLSNRWWIIVIPGFFLITTLVCITSLGNYIREINSKKI